MGDDAQLEALRAEARYRRERADLYRAKEYGGRPTRPGRLRELEQDAQRAEERLAHALSEQAQDAGASPSELIDARIAELGDWRGETLARIRELVKEADPEIVEAWKWRGVPVWEHAGIVCTGEAYKSVVKTTFFKGASLEDPAGLFNASLEGNTRRAIDFHEGEAIDEEAFKALVRAAVELNVS